MGAVAARAAWDRYGPRKWRTIFTLPSPKPVVLYGGLTPTGPGPAKFGITSRRPAARWAEYPESHQHPTLFIPLFTTEEYALEHRDLEDLLKSTYDAVWGREWVSEPDIFRVLKTVEESDLLVGSIKLWTPTNAS